MEAFVEVRSFVQECKAAGLTRDPGWTLPADTSELQRIVDSHSSLVRMIGGSTPFHVDPSHALKPLVWHIFCHCLKFTNESQ